MTLTSDTSTIYDVAKTKLTADARLEKAKASLYRCGGIGALITMVGMGIGLACFGVSYIADGRPQAEKIAQAMAQALEKARFTTTGELKMADGSTVSLTPGGQIAIAPGSVVGVDPQSTVRIGGVVYADARPATVTPTPGAVPSPQTKAVTEYTTFKKVSFSKGSVITGWSYDSSDQTRPTRQYCYYDEKVEDDNYVRTNLGVNGVRLANLEPRAGVDLAAAFNHCIWF